jgi:hypothetical protein
MTSEELNFERRRLAIETRLKRAEQRLARDQFEHQKALGGGWRALLTPTGGVLMAAAIGLLGTAAAKWADNAIERTKQETMIILKASEVPPTLSATPKDGDGIEK